MGRCAGITRLGQRCTHAAGGESGLCWLHDPSRAEARRANASKASRSQGKVPSPGAIARRVLETIERLEEGDIDPREAAVLSQLYNVLRGLVKVEHELRHADHEDRLRALEDILAYSPLAPGAPRDRRF